MRTTIQPSPEALQDRLGATFWLIVAFASISTLLSMSRLILPLEARSFLPPAVVLMPQLFCVIHLFFYHQGNQLRSLVVSAMFQLMAAVLGLYGVFRMESLPDFGRALLVGQVMWTIFIPVAAAFYLFQLKRQRHPALT